MKERYKIGLARTLLLLLLLLHTTITASAATINSITYTESTIDASNVQVISHTSYYDGTILLRLSYPPSTINCNEQKLFLRLIHLDGSINELNIDVPQIPPENFCLNLDKDHIKIHALSLDHIIVTYYCDLPLNLKMCRMIIDWNGNILDDKDFEASCDDNEVVRSIDHGFLWTCYMQGLNRLDWYKFNDPDSSGLINLLASGSLSNVNSFNSNLTRIFATENGGYGVVTSDEIKNNDPQNTLTRAIHVRFISQASSIVNGPFQIYYLNNVQRLDVYRCNIAYESYGYSCIINILRTNGQESFVNIGFSSSGSILNSMNEFTIDDKLITGTIIWDVLPLYYGGSLILTENVLNGKLNGLIFSDENSFYNNWDIPTDQYNITKNVNILPNNTIWTIAKSEVDGFWTLITSSLLSDYGSARGYGNGLVVSTVPPIDSTISLMSTQNLQIKFTNSIQLSKGNLSIIDYNSDVIRQIVNGQNGNFINLIDDHTVEINIFGSTFNRKSTPYYVLVDNGFVEDSNVGQELLGIKKGVWKFSTDSDSEEQPYLKESLFGSTSAIIKLTPAGTTYFVSLSSDEKDQFSKYLASNLSLIIPCDSSRISIVDRYQFDNDLIQRQVLLLVRIKRKEKNNADVDNVSSSQIAKDLDLLITYKDNNALSRESITSLLDDSYGARSIPSLWNRYKYILIGVTVGFCMLTVLYLLARRATREANNKIIFTFTFIMVDFALDVIFISTHGYDLPWLYPTSVALLSAPILLNIIFTYIIISKEIGKNNNFSKWWIKNFKTALLFTLLSGIDLESLNVASSHCFGSIKLSAPFMISTEYGIFFVNAVTVFIEDIPQFIVLVLYQRFTILPNIIPMLALSSCALVLLTKLFCLIKHNPVPSKSFGKKPEITTRSSKKDESYTDLSPILPPLTAEAEDLSRKKPRRNLFSSGPYSADNKRNSNSSNNGYFSEALKLFSSGGGNESPHSMLNEGNCFGRNEITGEPFFLLRDPEDYNVQKIKHLSHGKLVGDSIVSGGKFSPGKITSGVIPDKRLSNVGIICNTTSDQDEGENKNEEEISIDQNNEDNIGRSNSRGSTTDRTRSTHSFQTFNTATSATDDTSVGGTSKKLSSISLDQPSNLDAIFEKQGSNDEEGDDEVDDGNDGDEEKKATEAE